MSLPTAVMSHWSLGYNGGITQENRNSLHLAFLLAKKHFGEVHLITDSQGKRELDFLPWSSCLVLLDSIDPRLHGVWSYGKIIAFGEAATRFGNFIHIDNDCFLWKLPQKKLMEKSIYSLCQEVVGDNVLALNLPHVFRGYNSVINTDTKWMPNMSLCGGTDASIWLEYVSIVKAIVEDEGLACFWQGKSGPGYARAVIAEQWMLAAFLRRKMKSIWFSFPNESMPRGSFCNFSPSDAEALGITHLGHEKINPVIAQKIAHRLSQNPPNLQMSGNPTAADMALDFSRAAIQYAKTGFKNATTEEHGLRLSICKECDFWDANGYAGLGKCLKCGCSGAKLWMASSICPAGKWEKLT